MKKSKRNIGRWIIKLIIYSIRNVFDMSISKTEKCASTSRIATSLLVAIADVSLLSIRVAIADVSLLSIRVAIADVSLLSIRVSRLQTLVC